ncbi:MAG: hypothetical protein ABI229_02685, partial [Gemmatimonadaceae bacterium]
TQARFKLGLPPDNLTLRILHSDAARDRAMLDPLRKSQVRALFRSLPVLLDSDHGTGDSRAASECAAVFATACNHGTSA